jgi:hypothetical protein
MHLMRPRIAPTAALVALALIAALASTRGDALAHGNIDQSFDFGAHCHFSNFPGEEPANGARQTFKPAEPGLSGIDLCVLGDGIVNVTIRDSDGEVVGGASRPTTPREFDSYTHVNFLAPYPVTPDETYTIEITTPDAITWRGEVAGGPYIYDRGESNSGAVTDFAFRSYYAPLPATAVPSATHTTQPTATRTSTRTPTRTPEPSSTAAPAASATIAPPPAAGVAPPTEPPPPGSGAAPTASRTSSGQAQGTATRASGVLGISSFSTRVYLPGVGDGASRDAPARNSEAAPIALLAVGVLAVVTGITASRMHRFHAHR